MFIKKLLSEGEELKKTTAKSFRLRPTAITALEVLSEKTGISQNETLNIVLEEAHENLKALNLLEDLMVKHGRVKCYKYPFNPYGIRVEYVINFDTIRDVYNLYVRIYTTYFEYEGKENKEFLNVHTVFENIYDIFNFGFDTSFKIEGYPIENEK